MADRHEQAHGVVGTWTKATTAACADKYPATLTFSTGTYRGARGPGQGMVWWHAGIYRLEEPGKLVVGTATDELVTYQIDLVTSVSAPVFVPKHTKCQLSIVAEQFNYTQPLAGQFKGTFPNAPSRTVTLRLFKVAAPFPFSLTGGPYYEGRLFEGAVDKGSVTLGWVSRFFRRATLEIDTLTGAVRPGPVPDGAGGTEFFDTVYSKIGWQLSMVQDQLNVPVPGGVVPTNC